MPQDAPTDALKELKHLLSAGAVVTARQQHGNGVALTLASDGETQRIESANPAFVAFATAFYPAVDDNGQAVMRRFRDRNRYWNEIRYLCTNLEEKRRAAGQRLRSPDFAFDYDRRALLLEFLRSHHKADARFIALKQDHFEISGAFAYEATQLNAAHDEFSKAMTNANECAGHVGTLLGTTFFSDPPSILRRAIQFYRCVPTDFDDALRRAVAQQKIVHDLQGMLASRGELPAKDALPHVLDGYRRQCESIKPFIMALAQALRISRRGGPLKQGYQSAVEFIRHSAHGTIVECLDPHIRNAESHAATDIDDDRAVVTLTESRNGKRQTLREYSYWELTEMAMRLQHGLFPAVVSQFALMETTVLTLVLLTPGYVKLLLAIDNLADTST
jgi:hypothetical protein